MKNTSPWLYIPSAYFLEGIPYMIINAVSVVLYANLGFQNEQIVFWTSWLYLPWVLKMFWSPLIDSRSTKRRWMIRAQYTIAILFFILAGLNAYNLFAHGQVLNNMPFFYTSLFGFFIGAFLSATLDIATDGYYLFALTPKQQGYFVGIRTIFYRLAMIFANGILLAGAFALFKAPKDQPNPAAWIAIFIFLAVLFTGLARWHHSICPTPATDTPAQAAQHTVWIDAFKSYFTQKHIIYILLFILLYRLGDAMLEKIIPLFLLKPTTEGALGLSMQSYGLIKGTLGLGAIIAGNLLGGWLLGRFGFKKCIWPFAMAMVLPNFFYAYMGYAKPDLVLTATLITLENFGYGLAMMAFSVFVMYISQGPYKTSHYAISTGIMALGMMVPSMLSGKLQAAVGYERFFWITALISLLTFLIIPLLSHIKSIDDAEKTFQTAEKK